MENQSHHKSAQIKRQQDTGFRARSHMGSPLKMAAVGLCLLALAACGRMADPRLPDGQSDNYPATYPAGASTSSPDNIFRRAGRPD